MICCKCLRKKDHCVCKHYAMVNEKYLAVCWGDSPLADRGQMPDSPSWSDGTSTMRYEAVVEPAEVPRGR